MTHNISSIESIIVPETFESIYTHAANANNQLEWSSVFVLPDWISTWWDTFGGKAIPCLFSVQHQNDVAGIAMLQIQDHVASLIGNADVCDYMDFVVSPGKNTYFYAALFDYLAQNKIERLDLRCLRPDSQILNVLIPEAEKRGYDVISDPDGISLEVLLPDTWEDYLGQLKSKQRHEIKRKLRRLNEAGEIRFAVYDNLYADTEKIDLFFKLFRESRTDKTEFMTPQMESFFATMIPVMSEIKILKLGVLYLNETPVAAVLFFDYKDSLYLYNNGYNPDFRSLSVGVLCKVFAIQHGITLGKKTFDFLKGPEIYKYRLGGKEVPLTRCRIRFK